MKYGNNNNGQRYPSLSRWIFNGASRHRLCKGFLLLNKDWEGVDLPTCERVARYAEHAIQANPDLKAFQLQAAPSTPGVLSLITPFTPVYTPGQRDYFMRQLATASTLLLTTAEKLQCRIAAAGVNPYCQENEEAPRTLCADIHQIEVYDEGEIERIYNLYRHYLAELLAISTHSAVYGNVVQSDCSLRMRENQTSFLPRYISQFSNRSLDQLRGIVRRDYGLNDLNQMDINPLSGAELQSNQPLLGTNASAIELRFIDAQCSYPFLRAQMLLFQAIAMHGRSLARKGRRLHLLHDKSLDENKALAIRDGPAAVFKPDKGHQKKERPQSYSYHDLDRTEVATTALLLFIENDLLPALRHLSCRSWEILPIILGAELRRKGLRCFANYAEYQQFLCSRNSEQFVTRMDEQTRLLLTDAGFDIISDYNRDFHEEASREIEERWIDYLRPGGPTGSGQRPGNTSLASSQGPGGK
jgi:hypothetical protein